MKKRGKLREWLSIMIEKRPAMVVLLVIFLLNILFFFVAAAAISRLAPPSLEEHGFWVSVFYTITMILDAGCIQFVIENLHEASLAIVVVCLGIVLIGMITFTGAVIGYVTNYISSFIENASDGNHRLRLSGHIVILGWNNRASEIVNDLLYSGKREKVVILADEKKELIEAEIADRLSDTIEKENRAMRLERNASDKKGKPRRWGRRIHRPITIVRQGETYSTKQLNDIAVSQAKSVIILADGSHAQGAGRQNQGDTHTVKTLIQVAEMTSDENSSDNQRVIVEVEDEWTQFLAERIIANKEKLGKCNIVPVAVNQILGRILAQFCIMPELNQVYSELFSNRGATFYAGSEGIPADEADYQRSFLKNHLRSIPLTHMNTKTGENFFYVAEKEEDWRALQEWQPSGYTVEVSKKKTMDRRNLIILGHNSKCRYLFDGFNSFRNEWNRDCQEEILNVIVVDDQESLAEKNYYREYPYISRVVEASVFDKDIIYETITAFTRSNREDTSILILSDDSVDMERRDANALTYLIYVQDIIARRSAEERDFDRESIDVVVEILDPKNYDTVHNYSAENVVISNRYISKMVTQIGEDKALFEFYNDILSYDEEGKEAYESNEIYAKPVQSFFERLPGKCTAAELIRAVFDATPPGNKAAVLGYASPDGKLVLFHGDQTKIDVELTKRDKLIVFCRH